MSKIYLRPKHISSATIHKPGTLYGPSHTVAVNIASGGRVLFYRNDMESCEKLIELFGLTAVAENPSGEPEKPYKVTFDEATKTLTVEIHDEIKVKVVNQTKAYVTVNPPDAGDTITAPSVSVEERQEYRFKKGDRVRFIEAGDRTVMVGATGTVLESGSTYPYVRWDHPNMITEEGKSREAWKSQGKLCAHQDELALIK